jgi:hypothetical protein
LSRAALPLAAAVGLWPNDRWQCLGIALAAARRLMSGDTYLLDAEPSSGVTDRRFAAIPVNLRQGQESISARSRY